LLIDNIILHTPFLTIEDGAVLISDGLIQFAGEKRELLENQADHVINGQGLHLIPGLIDLQLNGGFGNDFTYDPSTIWEVGAQLPQFGVTAFLPTIITSPPEKMRTAQKVVLAGPPPGYNGAKVLGLHIEGPFLAPEKKGAHNPAYILPPDPDLYEGFSPETGVRLVTLAPEQPGATEVIGQLTAQGILVSAGHSTASFDQAKAAFDQGIRYGTHLFNAMPAYHQHNPGLVGALLDDKRVTSGLICDGIHVHPATVRMIWRMLGPERLTLVTDAMGALGCPMGEYQLGDFPVIVDETSARLKNGTLAGSILTADQAIRNLLAFTECSISQAVQTMSFNPAQCLGLASKIGQIGPGKQADLILLNKKYQVMMAIIDGEIIYEKPLISHP
jgi:N-acetylglucosamine-6-phosphate deacetylase